MWNRIKRRLMWRITSSGSCLHCFHSLTEPTVRFRCCIRAVESTGDSCRPTQAAVSHSLAGESVLICFTSTVNQPGATSSWLNLGNRKRIECLLCHDTCVQSISYVCSSDTRISLHVVLCMICLFVFVKVLCRHVWKKGRSAPHHVNIGLQEDVKLYY